MTGSRWKVVNPTGSRRVVVTKELPGRRWLEALEGADARVEYSTSTRIMARDEIAAAIGDRCDAAIGQLTERWGNSLFAALSGAGGTAYSNYAVGFDNVDVEAATRHGIPVGNTPGVLTEATAEMAAALTLAAARRIAHGDRFMRAGRYTGWLPTLFLGEMLTKKTVGVVGAGRIGAAFARLMAEGFRMDLIYCDPQRNHDLEDRLRDYSDLLVARGEDPLQITHTTDLGVLLELADVVSVHVSLDCDTHHLIDGQRLGQMKRHAILVNTSRGPVVDESALVEHCRANPDFSAGLDVFEDEPEMKPGLAKLDNVVLVPHIASATRWTREAMATLAASNVAAMLRGWPVAPKSTEIRVFLGNDPPRAAPSIVNARELGLPTLE
jgi:hydroxypyruvate reductase 1